MADTRINALSTASSSASDDYVPIDGTTNGTRKLSAYSPSFGGNATVGGTLTVSGTGTSSFGGPTTFRATNATSFTPLATSAIEINYPSLSRVTIGENTAGSANPAFTFYRTYSGSAQGTAVRLFQPNANGDLYVQKGTTNAVYGNETYSTNFVFSYEGNLLIGGTTEIPGNGGLKVYGTTASISTSSGALVVGNGTSGGLGVGGAVNIGSTLTVGGQANFANGTTFKWDTSGDVYARQIFTGAGGTDGVKLSQGSGIGIIAAIGNGGLSFRDDGNQSLLSLADATGNAVFLGSVQTGAPTGGTAAAWKLGAVATVSPTSPNRTIEVDIGGTIYYIHAKTTNN